MDNQYQLQLGLRVLLLDEKSRINSLLDRLNPKPEKNWHYIPVPQGHYIPVPQRHYIPVPQRLLTI